MPRFHAVASTVAVSACAVMVAACGGAKHTAAPVAAPTTAATTTTTTIPPVTYTVQRGDTLSKIAKQFGGTVEALVAANHIANANSVAQGQVLVIPTPPTTAPSPSSSIATTTSIPAGPVALDISPSHAQVGNVFNIKLTGAKSGEVVTFEIDSPDGRKTTGQPHTAAADGSVLASYLTTQANGPGQYTVIATGSLGTSARGTFSIDPTTA